MFATILVKLLIVASSLFDTAPRSDLAALIPFKAPSIAVIADSAFAAVPRSIADIADNEEVDVAVVSKKPCSVVVLLDVTLRDEDSATGYYAKELILPPNTSLRVLNGGEKLILTPNNNLYVRSNVDNSIDAILSTVEIV